MDSKEQVRYERITIKSEEPVMVTPDWATIKPEVEGAVVKPDWVTIKPEVEGAVVKPDCSPWINSKTGEETSFHWQDLY
jgi:hypothetical protein